MAFMEKTSQEFMGGQRDKSCWGDYIGERTIFRETPAPSLPFFIMCDMPHLVPLASYSPCDKWRIILQIKLQFYYVILLLSQIFKK